MRLTLKPVPAFLVGAAMGATSSCVFLWRSQCSRPRPHFTDVNAPNFCVGTAAPGSSRAYFAELDRCRKSSMIKGQSMRKTRSTMALAAGFLGTFT